MLIGVRDKVISLRKASPCATLQEIGDKTGTSKQRVAQILASENLPTKHYRQKYLCRNCGREMPLNHDYCSSACWQMHHSVIVECDFCHKQFHRRISNVLSYDERHKRKYVFCGKICQGKWLSSQNVARWDYSMVWDTQRKTGFGAPKLSRLLNIPESTVSKILRKGRQDGHLPALPRRP